MLDRRDRSRHLLRAVRRIGSGAARAAAGRVRQRGDRADARAAPSRLREVGRSDRASLARSNSPRSIFRSTFARPPFRCASGKYLQSIPYGDVQSYREVAAGIGRPKAARAVGDAARAQSRCASSSPAIASSATRATWAAIVGDSNARERCWISNAQHDEAFLPSRVCAVVLAVSAPVEGAPTEPKFCQGCNFAGAQLSNSDFSNARARRHGLPERDARQCDVCRRAR